VASPGGAVNVASPGGAVNALPAEPGR